MKKRIFALLMIFAIVVASNSVFAMSTQQQELNNDGSFVMEEQNQEELPVTTTTTKKTTKKANTENKVEETNQTPAENLIQSEASKLYTMAKKEKQSLEDYKAAYGNDSYGTAAYVLHMVQIYSIPFCFVGFALAAIYQYVLGVRKLDTRDKGWKLMISIMTVFVIAQILPLVFALVVKGWGN